jgi:hypothetical protein
MGCASSKPSSSSSSKTKGKSKDAINKQHQQKGKTTTNQQNSEKQRTSSSKSAAPKQPQQKQSLHDQQANQNCENLNEQIRIDDALLKQIKENENDVINYIVIQVRKELNAELISAKNGSGSPQSKNPVVAAVITSNGSANKASLAKIVAAAEGAQDNDDLILDVASKAVLLIESSRRPTNYRHLCDSLKSAQYLCKVQKNKDRICELTVQTIRNCLNHLTEEQAKNGKYNLIDVLNEANQHDEVDTANKQYQPNGHMTPPQTPKMPNDKNAVLLTRAQATEVARMLFLSNRARPVVHASPSVKDAYFVNKQMFDDSEVTVSQSEIDDILNAPKLSINDIILQQKYKQHQQPSSPHANGAANGATPVLNVYSTTFYDNYDISTPLSMSSFSTPSPAAIVPTSAASYAEQEPNEVIITGVATTKITVTDVDADANPDADFDATGADTTNNETIETISGADLTNASYGSTSPLEARQEEQQLRQQPVEENTASTGEDQGSDENARMSLAAAAMTWTTLASAVADANKSDMNQESSSPAPESISTQQQQETSDQPVDSERIRQLEEDLARNLSAISRTINEPVSHNADDAEKQKLGRERRFSSLLLKFRKLIELHKNKTDGMHDNKISYTLVLYLFIYYYFIESK